MEKFIKTNQVDKGIKCPNRGKFVGPHERIPYCGTGLSKKKSLKYMRYVSIIVAIAGLGCLQLVAMNRKTHVKNMKKNTNKILAVIAHPDDETVFSGTIALLADENIPVHIVYATSGNGGGDKSGRNLSGNELAAVREIETQDSLKILGAKIPPIFLKYNDGKLKNEIESLRIKISDLFDKIQPNIVITFGPDGISGHPDHIAIGAVTDYIFDRKNYVDTLLHVAVSEARTQIYNSVAENYIVEHEVNDNAVNLKIDVEKYKEKRLKAAETYITQFNKNDCKAFENLISKTPYEEFIIVRKRGMKDDTFDH